MGTDSVGLGGLGFAFGGGGADLGGVLGAEEDFFELVAAEPGEMLGDEEGVVEAAGTDVFGVGGEGDDDDATADFGESGIEKFGERTGEGASGMVF